MTWLISQPIFRNSCLCHSNILNCSVAFTTCDTTARSSILNDYNVLQLPQINKTCSYALVGLWRKRLKVYEHECGCKGWRESRKCLRRGEVLIVACRRGAGSTCSVSHAMVDSDAPVALPSTLIAGGVASRTSAFLFGLLIFYLMRTASQSVVEKRCPSYHVVALFIYYVYVSICMYTQASRSVPAKNPLPWKPLDRLS